MLSRRAEPTAAFQRHDLHHDLAGRYELAHQSTSWARACLLSTSTHTTIIRAFD
jgi:hypothetical protein